MVNDNPLSRHWKPKRAKTTDEIVKDELRKKYGDLRKMTNAQREMERLPFRGNRIDPEAAKFIAVRAHGEVRKELATQLEGILSKWNEIWRDDEAKEQVSDRDDRRTPRRE